MSDYILYTKEIETQSIHNCIVCYEQTHFNNMQFCTQCSADICIACCDQLSKNQCPQCKIENIFDMEEYTDEEDYDDEQDSYENYDSAVFNNYLQEYQSFESRLLVQHYRILVRDEILFIEDLFNLSNQEIHDTLLQEYLESTIPTQYILTETLISLAQQYQYELSYGLYAAIQHENAQPHLTSENTFIYNTIKQIYLQTQMNAEFDIIYELISEISQFLYQIIYP